MSKLTTVAATAAFIHEGFIESLKDFIEADIRDELQLGHYDAVYEMVSHAEFLCEEFDRHLITKDAPGVVDYEVSPAFGYWFGEYIKEHGDVPNEALCRAYITKRMDKFFDGVGK